MSNRAKADSITQDFYELSRKINSGNVPVEASSEFLVKVLPTVNKETRQEFLESYEFGLNISCLQASLGIEKGFLNKSSCQSEKLDILAIQSIFAPDISPKLSYS